MKKHGSYKCFITALLILFVSMAVHAQSAASKSSYAYLQQRFAQPDQQCGSDYDVYDYGLLSDYVISER